MKLSCPSQITDRNMVGFLSRCNGDATTCADLHIDFGPAQFAFPYATLLLASGLKQLVERRQAQGLFTNIDPNRSVSKAAGYLTYMGFFQYIGVDYGNEPGEVSAGTSYLPLTIIERGTLESRRNSNTLMQHAIKEESERLATVLLGEENLCEAIMLSYCLREVIRNVFEHANTDACILMAQNYPQRDMAEIAVMDGGIGIFASLSNAHSVLGVDDAIEKALQPGISRICAPQHDDEWANSGFGLYVLSTLGAEHGSFGIASDGRLLKVNSKGSQWANLPVQGTAIKLRISTKNAEYFPNILQQIVIRGEDAIESVVGKRRSASKSTKAVSTTA